MPGLKFPVVAETSLFCLSKANPLRNLALIIARNAAFDAFMLAIIIFNFALLAASDPRGSNPADDVSSKLEGMFTGLFTAEAVIKIVALGAGGSLGYFADGWNCFDFLVVVLCALPRARARARAPSCAAP